MIFRYILAYILLSGPFYHPKFEGVCRPELAVIASRIELRDQKALGPKLLNEETLAKLRCDFEEGLSLPTLDYVLLFPTDHELVCYEHFLQTYRGALQKRQKVDWLYKFMDYEDAITQVVRAENFCLFIRRSRCENNSMIDRRMNLGDALRLLED